MIRRAIKEGVALIGLGFELLFLLAQEKLREHETPPAPREDATLIETPVVRISLEAEAMLASSNRATKTSPAADTLLEGSIEARRSRTHLG